LELVWLCADGATTLVPVAPSLDASALTLPPALAAHHPRLLLGVRSNAGQEGYYALGFSAQAVEAAPPGEAALVVLFVGVDEDGAARPGAWSYGQPVTGPSEYGVPPRPFPEALAP